MKYDLCMPFSPSQLNLRIDSIRYQGLQLDTAGGWTRHSTVVELRGAGHTGKGEDVTYSAEDQHAFQKHGVDLDLSGIRAFGELSDLLDHTELFSSPPGTKSSLDFRRWAFESAAFDLALRQNKLSLADLVGRKPEPVTFVHSTGLGSPPSIKSLTDRLEILPDLRFKIDFQPEWTESFIDELAALNAIDVVDLKGHYFGTFQGPKPSPALYRAVAERMPLVWLEDPAWDHECQFALEPFQDRVTWDAILHRIEDLDNLPFVPAAINVKPSRFGTVERLFRVYEWADTHAVTCYSGGQFELGPGRMQLQHLASLFHPHAGNDVAPSEYNDFPWKGGMPVSPLKAFDDVKGFGGV